MFSSRSFIVSGLTFRSLIDFEGFFCVCMVLESVLVSFFYKWLTSLFLCMVLESVQVSFFYKSLTSFPSTTY